MYRDRDYQISQSPDFPAWVEFFVESEVIAWAMRFTARALVGVYLVNRKRGETGIGVHIPHAITRSL